MGKLYLYLTYGRGSVLFWWHSDKLRTSVFTDDVITSAHHIITSQRRHTAEAQCTRSLGFGYKRRVGIPAAGSSRTAARDYFS